MIKIFLFVILTIFVSLSFGVLLNKKFAFQNNDFVTPIGFAGLMATLQILYYPMQIFNLSSYYRNILTTLVFILLLIYAFINLKEIKNILFQRRNLLIVFTTLFFVFVFYKVSVSINFGDAQMYLNYMSQNIRNDHVNLFNIWTGKLGQEWDSIYLYQGFYHFGSYSAYMINFFNTNFGLGAFVENIAIEIWGLSLIYSIVSSMIIYNIINYFTFSKYFKYVILAFTLLFTNYYYWRISYSFYGNTFRTIYITLLIFFLYQYFKKEKKSYKYLIIIIMFAGLSFSSSFLFIAFVIMYCLLVYLLLFEPKGSIAEMADFVIPMLIYIMAFYKKSPLFDSVFIIIIILYFVLRKVEFLQNFISKIEILLHTYARLIFIYIIPISTIIYTAILYFFINKYYPYSYASYFDNHQNYDMIKDYFFVYSSWYDNILNIVRWLGVGLILFNKSDDKGLRFMKYLFIIAFIMFLNPLNTAFIAKNFASNVYYRSFEVIFNPFTETLFIYLIYKKFSKRIIKTGLILIMIMGIFMAQSGLIVSNGFLEYRDAYENGKVINGVFKIESSELQVLKAFKEILKTDYTFNPVHQLTIISQAEGTRAFIPEAYQIFTVRQYWYSWDRVDQNFYECARRHYSWMFPPKAYYSLVPDYINDYEVDYVIIRYNENSEFDIATDKCMTTIYDDGIFKIKKAYS